MGKAKKIVVKVIPAKIANPFVRDTHYSGKVVPNSQLHFGAFMNGVLHGVMSFGPSMDKTKLIGLIRGTKWNEFIELNRMAFDDTLPKNSESRCISIAMKLIKKNAPQIKWVVSFADGTQCGDGAIYRASGFVLTGISRNHTILELPNGKRYAYMTLGAHWDSKAAKEAFVSLGITPRPMTQREWLENGAKQVEGFMLRYIYFIDKECARKLNAPIIPFSEIDKIGARMYKGVKIK